MLGVCVGSAALVIVLSVFNGLEQLNRQIFEVSNPDLSISAIAGKTFEKDSLLVEKIKANNQLDFLIETIEDNALGKQEEEQLIVVVKGVDNNFKKLKKLGESTVDGQMYVQNENGDFAFVGAGVYSFLNLTVLNVLNQLEIWYPKNQKLSVLNPEDNIERIKLPISGVFALEQNYDNYVYINLELAERLTGKYGQRTAYELYLKEGSDIAKVKKEINAYLPSNLIAKDREELNEALFKAIRIEKLFIFIALLFIIGIASFNIFFSLSMLVLDKKDDIQTLSAMGASSGLIRNIFLKEGFIISGIGSIIGIVLGSLICLSQMYFGWLSMGMENAIVDAYPVLLKFADIAISFVGILVITVFASFFPAQKATTFMKSI